ncbi:hypothetical protein HK405_009367, partial [Cladochytrium tenue]
MMDVDDHVGSDNAAANTGQAAITAPPAVLAASPPLQPPPPLPPPPQLPLPLPPLLPPLLPRPPEASSSVDTGGALSAPPGPPNYPHAAAVLVPRVSGGIPASALTPRPKLVVRSLASARPSSSDGRKGRGKGFSKEEVTRILDCVAEVLPTGGNDWKKVEVLYNHRRPPSVNLRDAYALKRKFRSLRSARGLPRTAAPPDDVRRARAIDQLIAERIGERLARLAAAGAGGTGEGGEGVGAGGGGGADDDDDVDDDDAHAAGLDVDPSDSSDGDDAADEDTDFRAADDADGDTGVYSGGGGGGGGGSSETHGDAEGSGGRERAGNGIGVAAGDIGHGMASEGLMATSASGSGPGDLGFRRKRP